MQNTFSCGCMLLFTDMQFSCKHGGGGVSTWAKFDGHICPCYYANVYIPLYYVLRGLLLFICEVYCLQTCE